MKKRPKSFAILSGFLIFICAFMPIQIMFQFGHPPSEWQAILAKLSPLNWLTILSAAILAVALLRASPWVWAIAPVFLAVVTWNNWIVGIAELNSTIPLAVAGTVIVYAVVFSGILQKDARRVLMKPKLRWWLTPPRKKARLRVSVWPTVGGEFSLHTFDLSEGGAFIVLKTELGPKNLGLARKNLKVGSHCLLKLNLSDERILHCHAEVVRHMEERRGTYPAGIGVRFVQLSRSQRQFIAEFLDKVNEGYDYSLSYPSGKPLSRSLVN